MTTTPEPTYQHAEAFCLMTYQSKDGHGRLVWNSRDGVTPFGFTDPTTGVELRHVNWRGDIRAEHHVPEVGDLVFVDLNHERALELAVRFVDRWWDRDDPPFRCDTALPARASRGGGDD